MKLIRAKSDDVEPPAIIDLLHVDGSHTIQAQRDVERFAPNVRPGGIVFLDDIHWAGGGVEKAMEKLMSMGFRHLSSRDTGGFFEKIPVSASAPVEPAKTTRKPRGGKTAASKK